MVDRTLWIKEPDPDRVYEAVEVGPSTVSVDVVAVMTCDEFPEHEFWIVALPDRLNPNKFKAMHGNSGFGIGHVEAGTLEEALGLLGDCMYATTLEHWDKRSWMRRTERWQFVSEEGDPPPPLGIES